MLSWFMRKTWYVIFEVELWYFPLANVNIILQILSYHVYTLYVDKVAGNGKSIHVWKIFDVCIPV